MKTKLLLSTLLISALSIKAQITVNTGDMPVAGQTYIMANDSTITSFGNAGANQTWNFSSWQNQTRDTSVFVNPSSLTGSSSFPTANLGVDGGTSGSTFMKNSSTSFDLLGFYDSNFGAVPINPSEKTLSFPSTYQTTYTGTSKYSVQFYIGQQGLDSVRLKVKVNYTSNIDAWGTITTPALSNVASLRQKFVQIRTDSTFIKPTGLPWTLEPSTQANPNPSIDTINSFLWWSNTHKFNIADVETDGSGNVTSARYLLSSTVGINELSMPKNNISIFPNPASDHININGVSTESVMVIFDENGKLVSQNILTKNAKINTSAYTSGIYFYQIVPLNGSTINKGKFVISK